MTITRRAGAVLVGMAISSSRAGVSAASRRPYGPPRMAIDPLLDAKGAARILGVKPTWVLAEARAGRIPHVRLGH